MISLPLKEKLKGKTLPPSKTPGQSDVKAGAVAFNLSAGKGTEKSDTKQGKVKKSSSEDEERRRADDREAEKTFADGLASQGELKGSGK